MLDRQPPEENQIFDFNPSLTGASLLIKEVDVLPILEQSLFLKSSGEYCTGSYRFYRLRLVKPDQYPQFFRESYNPVFPAGEWISERANALKIAKTPPPPLLKGRHLIKEGLTPSQKFGSLLEVAYQAQLNEEIHSVPDAIKLLKDNNLL